MSIQDIVIKIKGWVGEENLCKIRVFLPFGAIGISLITIIYASFLSGAIIERRKTITTKPPIIIELPPRLQSYAAVYREAKPVLGIIANEQPSKLHTNETSASNNSIQKNFITSKTGKVYYPAHCKSVNRIKPENRVYYESSSELIARGYTLSKTCTP